MRRRGILLQRPAVEWVIRGMLAIAVATAGSAGVTRTLAYAMRGTDVARAHALAPSDGRITALLAQMSAGADATAADRARADALARRALRQDPTAVAAVATLGLDTQIRGDVAGARRLFAYAQLLSRRDLPTQLWAVEDAVGRGDVAGALRHYDIALRTTRAAPDLLFPVLGSAISDAAIRSGLARTLADRPAWGGSFIDWVAGHGPDPRATASLFLGLRRSGVAVSEEARSLAVDNLLVGGFVDGAWSYYAALRPGADRRRSRDPGFAADLVSPSPFDWTPVNEAGVVTSIQRGDSGGGVFDFMAPSSVGGPLLRQVQVLPPGSYRLEGHSAEIDQPEGSRPYWVLDCRDGRELGRVAMPNSAQANGRFVGGLTVPPGCPVQTLSLVARPSDAVSGVAGQIDRVRLYPHGGDGAR